MLYGSIMAMNQTDIRKILAYSSVAQIGYISLGFAIGTPIALAGAFLHMLGHAFMKGGLFFCTGAIRYKYGTSDIDDFGRLVLRTETGELKTYHFKEIRFVI
jgi:multicomponent Na+:H+ antiporter subunit D